MVSGSEFVVFGPFSLEEVYKLYPEFLDRAVLELKSIDVDVEAGVVSPQITVYLQDNHIHKYYIGLGYNLLYVAEKQGEIIDSIARVFRKLGVSIDTRQTHVIHSGREENVYVIPVYGLKDLDSKDLSTGLNELNKILNLFSRIKDNTLYGEASLVYDIEEDSYYIWIDLLIKPDLSSLKKMYSLLLRYRDYRLDTEYKLAFSDDLLTDYGLLKNMLNYIGHVYRRLIYSNRLGVEEKIKYVLDYLDHVEDMYFKVKHGPVFNSICDILRQGCRTSATNYVALIDRLCSIIDTLSEDKFNQLVNALKNGLPSVLENIESRPCIESLDLLNKLIERINDIYIAFNRSRIDMYDAALDKTRIAPQELLETYIKVIDSIYKVVESIEPSVLIDYINKQESIHHILSMMVKYRMFNESKLFLRSVETSSIVSALEKLLFREYWYKGEINASNSLSRFRVSDGELIRRYASLFSKVDIRSLDKKYLKQLLMYYSDLLPDDFTTKATNILYTSAKKQIERLLSKRRYTRVIRVLSKQPRVVAEQLTRDIVWPRINRRVNKILEKNPVKALDFIDKLLGRIGWICIDSPLYLLKTKLQGKRLSVIRRLQRSSS